MENLLNRSTKRISCIINTLQDKRYIHIKPKNNIQERQLFPLVVINECEGCFRGLFIPIDVLSDYNLNDKEKFILSIALYYSNIRKTCTLNNENLKDIFGVTKNYKKVLYSYNRKVHEDIEENVNVLKSKNKNYKKYNGFHNYEGRQYPKDFFESLYANL